MPRRIGLAEQAHGDESRLEREGTTGRGSGTVEQLRGESRPRRVRVASPGLDAHETRRGAGAHERADDGPGAGEDDRQVRDVVAQVGRGDRGVDHVMCEQEHDLGRRRGRLDTGDQEPRSHIR